MSKTQYLQQLGRSWYLRVKIPASLHGKVGSTHIRRALHTRDLDETNRRKWAALAHVHAYLDAVATGEATEASLPTNFSSPTASNLKLPAVASTESGTSARLDALSKEWADATQSKTLRFQRLQVYRELRNFLGLDQKTTGKAKPSHPVTWRRCLLLRSAGPSSFGIQPSLAVRRQRW